MSRAASLNLKATTKINLTLQTVLWVEKQA